jgi:hypothetical protein
MDEIIAKFMERAEAQLQRFQSLFDAIRLPTTWYFELPVILTSASWFATSRFSSYAAGSAYSLTATSALLNFGTTDPQIVITTPGTYMLFARVRLDYNGATFASARTVSLKIRRTNNTAGDVISTQFKTRTTTTESATAGIIALPVAIYTTTNKDDALELRGDVSVIPSAGSLDAVEAELVAVRVV